MNKQEKQEEVVMKLGLSPEIVKMYDMQIYDNTLIIEDHENSVNIDITDKVEISDNSYSWDFLIYIDGKVACLVTINKNPKIKGLRVRIW